MGGMERAERDILVRLMYCSSVGLEDKGGIQSDLPWKGHLGGSGLFLKKCLILRDLRPLLRTRSEIWSRGWLLNV